MKRGEAQELEKTVRAAFARTRGVDPYLVPSPYLATRVRARFEFLGEEFRVLKVLFGWTWFLKWILLPGAALAAIYAGQTLVRHKLGSSPPSESQPARGVTTEPHMDLVPPARPGPGGASKDRTPAPGLSGAPAANGSSEVSVQGFGQLRSRGTGLVKLGRGEGSKGAVTATRNEGDSTEGPTEAPAELSATEVRDSSGRRVRLSWSVAEAKASRLVEVERSFDGKSFQVIGATRAQGRTFFDPIAPESWQGFWRPVYYRAAADGSQGRTYSNTAQLTILPDTPEAPVNLASQEGDTGISLRWTDPLPQFGNQFRVEGAWGSSPDSFTLIRETAQTEALVLRGPAEETLTLRVQALNGALRSGYSALYRINPPRLAPPTGLTLQIEKKAGVYEAALSWTGGDSRAVAYRASWAAGANGSFTPLPEVGGGASHVSFALPEGTVPGTMIVVRLVALGTRLNSVPASTEAAVPEGGAAELAAPILAGARLVFLGGTGISRKVAVLVRWKFNAGYTPPSEPEPVLEVEVNLNGHGFAPLAPSDPYREGFALPPGERSWRSRPITYEEFVECAATSTDRGCGSMLLRAKVTTGDGPSAVSQVLSFCPADIDGDGYYASTKNPANPTPDSDVGRLLGAPQGAYAASRDILGLRPEDLAANLSIDADDAAFMQAMKGDVPPEGARCR